ncbi:MAG: hypothetical protein KatS3mg002_0942 [Candidatus Woesearchaeota archaeon]|nr:MAG: hypothetical protein KatS3mg002_0942 [Candidatus Woesearchaeota archaeon]
MEYNVKDKTLLNISLIISVLGLLILFLLMFLKSEKFIPKYPMYDSDAYSDTKITLRGVITNLSYQKNNTIFTLSHECEIDVIVFNHYIDENYSNTPVIVSGKINEYKGKRNIIADKIISNNGFLDEKIR